MQVSTETLVEMLREVEADDPIDYADLPFGEQELRQLVMSSLVSVTTRSKPAIWPCPTFTRFTC